MSEEKIRFLKAENRGLKAFNKELALEVKELRSSSPERNPQPDAESPEKPEAEVNPRKELLVSTEAKAKIQEM